MFSDSLANDHVFYSLQLLFRIFSIQACPPRAAHLPQVCTELKVDEDVSVIHAFGLEELFHSS